MNGWIRYRCFEWVDLKCYRIDFLADGLVVKLLYLSFIIQFYVYGVKLDGNCCTIDYGWKRGMWEGNRIGGQTISFMWPEVEGLRTNFGIRKYNFMHVILT